MKTDLTEPLTYCRTLARELNLPLKILKCEAPPAYQRQPIRQLTEPVGGLGLPAKAGDETSRGLNFYYLSPEKTDLRTFRRELNRRFKIKINLVPLENQEAAILIPGYSPCGKRLCWTSDSCENLWPCKFKEAPPAPETAPPVQVEESAPISPPAGGSALISVPPISENQSPKKFIRRLILK